MYEDKWVVDDMALLIKAEKLGLKVVFVELKK